MSLLFSPVHCWLSGGGLPSCPPESPPKGTIPRPTSHLSHEHPTRPYLVHSSPTQALYLPAAGRQPWPGVKARRRLPGRQNSSFQQPPGDAARRQVMQRIVPGASTGQFGRYWPCLDRWGGRARSDRAGAGFLMDEMQEDLHLPPLLPQQGHKREIRAPTRATSKNTGAYPPIRPTPDTSHPKNQNYTQAHPCPMCL